jgi:hypothetical protein
VLDGRRHEAAAGHVDLDWEARPAGRAHLLLEGIIDGGTDKRKRGLVLLAACCVQNHCHRLKVLAEALVRLIHHDYLHTCSTCFALRCCACVLAFLWCNTHAACALLYAHASRTATASQTLQLPEPGSRC